MEKFDVNSLTLGEVSKVEELSGQSINSVGETSAPKGKTLMALVYVIKKRSEPKYTLAQASALTLDEATEAIGFDDEDEAADSPKDETQDS